MSAPPSSPSASPPKAPEFADRIREEHQSPAFKFEPSIPPDYSREARISKRAPRTSVPPINFSPAPVHGKREDSGDELDVIGADTSRMVVESMTNNEAAYEEESAEEEEEEQEEEQEDEEQADEDRNTAVSQRLASGGEVAVRRSPQQQTSWFVRVLYVLFTLVASTGTYYYKSEAAPIGYCDTGKNTNNALDAVTVRWAAIEACNQENRTFLQLPASFGGSERRLDEEPILCPPPALLPFLHPTHCTPCPEHAICAKGTMTCENGYLLHAHPALSLLSPFGLATPTTLHKQVGEVFNGLPGLGPVAFPQRCDENPLRKLHIGALGKAVEALLGQERGARICAGNKMVISDGGEARNWGMEIGELRDAMKQKTPVCHCSSYRLGVSVNGCQAFSPGSI